MNKVFIFDIDDTLIIHTKEDNDYYNIDPGEDIKQLIESLGTRHLYIYTNGTYGHGHQVIKNLKLLFHFSLIFGRDNIPIDPPYQMKPFLRSFKYVQETIEDKIQSKNNTFYFFDDMKANLRTAKSLGWVTILIHPDFINQDEEYIDYLFPNIYHALVFFSLKKGQ